MPLDKTFSRCKSSTLQQLVHQVCKPHHAPYLLAGLLASPAQGFEAVLNVSSLDSEVGFAITGELANDRLGRSLGPAGDLNGDGAEDIIIGAREAERGDNNKSGIAYVLFGPLDSSNPPPALSALDGDNGFAIPGLSADDRLSYAISGGGDINGDGVDDLVIGAFNADPGQRLDAGETYLIFGRNRSSFPPSLDLTSMSTSEGFILEGMVAGDYLGNAVSVAGDLNGDNRHDLVINASGTDRTEAEVDVGTTYVIFGVSQGSSGFPPALSELDGTNGFAIHGVSAGDFAGYKLASGGDVNGDGVDDLILGTATANGNYSGSAYVVFGHSAVAQERAIATDLELSSLDGKNGFTIPGLAENDNLGNEVAIAGDVNGDGVDDVLIGALGVDTGGDYAGAAYLIFGRHDGVFPSTLSPSSLDGSNGFTMIGNAQFDLAGTSASGAGDVNVDGLDDILIGARGVDGPNGSYAGAAYVVYGRPVGGFPASLDLSSLDGGAKGFTVSDGVTGDNLAHTLSEAGDINGDGYDDMLIGQHYGDRNNLNDSGTVYLIFGRVVPLFADGFE